MATGVFPTPYGSISTPSRGRMQAHFGISVGAARLSTDPLFYATLTLQNVRAGSRYRITRTGNGEELATGVASGSGLVDVEISGVPVYANPMQVDIVIRNASGTPAYKPFETKAYMDRTGAAAYILQIED
jgi:hypothetical protein